MEMISNETFRLIGPETTYKDFDPGIYRIIINSVARGLIACSLIANENSETSKTRAGKRKRKKSPLPLVGKLRWIPKWTTPSFIDKPEPHFEAASKTSGLTPPRWECLRVRL